jgi:hypothetical protein
LGDSDDDEHVAKVTLPSGNKRKVKKPNKRVCYDESKADPWRKFS